jgi:transcriptional regulator with XRE-family HTH domain
LVSEPISAAITAALRVARERVGSTRDDVAEAVRTAGAPASFTASALRNLESGRRAPTLDELVWLAAALTTTPRALLGEHGALFGADEPAQPYAGPVEAVTRAGVAELDDLDGHQMALAESAYALARQLDGDAGMATAAIARELRAHLADIWADAAADDDDDVDLGPS